jgi:hypothetical protein
MFADISHSPVETLTGCNKPKMVLSHNDSVDGGGDNHGKCKTMEPCIARFRTILTNDLEIRCGLLVETEYRGVYEDVKELPTDIAVSCLLNPLVGGKHCCFGHCQLSFYSNQNRCTVVFIAHYLFQGKKGY